jgi:hypothetical protein
MVLQAYVDSEYANGRWPTIHLRIHIGMNEAPLPGAHVSIKQWH